MCGCVWRGYVSVVVCVEWCLCVCVCVSVCGCLCVWLGVFFFNNIFIYSMLHYN